MNREPQLPHWARELKLRYLSGESSMFLLHGNVRDLFPWEDADGRVTFWSRTSSSPFSNRPASSSRRSLPRLTPTSSPSTVTRCGTFEPCRTCCL